MIQIPPAAAAAAAQAYHIYLDGKVYPRKKKKVIQATKKICKKLNKKGNRNIFSY